MGFDGLQVNFTGIQSCGVGAGDKGGLLVDVLGFLPDQALPGHAGHKGGDNDKAEYAKDKVCQYKFWIEGLFHGFRTSNLYPIPHMVEIFQLA